MLLERERVTDDDDGWNMVIMCINTLGANTRTHLVDALPELLEREGVTDDVLHGELTSGDHGDCLDMGTVMDDFLAAFYIFQNSSVLSCQELIVERGTLYYLSR